MKPINRKNICDIDSDFLILPWQGGIRLEKPEALQNKNFMSVGNFFTFPFNIYFFDLHNIFIRINEENAIRHGNASVNEPIGKPLTVFFTDENVTDIIAYHQQVLDTQKLCIKEESRTNRSNQIIVRSAISFKFPWYDGAGTLRGVFGCSVMPEVQDLPATLSTLVQMKLLTNNPGPDAHLSGKQFENHYLSKRELDCLKLLARGNTAKMTGQYLGISPRTVESYIESIKCKLNVYSKAELCAKAIEYGLMHIGTTLDKQ